jgi:hypothetical protein
MIEWNKKIVEALRKQLETETDLMQEAIIIVDMTIDINADTNDDDDENDDA